MGPSAIALAQVGGCVAGRCARVGPGALPALPPCIPRWCHNAAVHPGVAIGELIPKKKKKKSCRSLTEVLQAIDACLKSGWFWLLVSHRAWGSCAIRVNAS